MDKTALLSSKLCKKALSYLTTERLVACQRLIPDVRYVSFFSGGPGTSNAWGYSYKLGWPEDELLSRKQNYLCPMSGVSSDNSDKCSMEFSCVVLNIAERGERRQGARTDSVSWRTQPMRGQHERRWPMRGRGHSSTRTGIVSQSSIHPRVICIWKI